MPSHTENLRLVKFAQRENFSNAMLNANLDKIDRFAGDVDGKYVAAPASDGTFGQVLRTNGSGVRYWDNDANTQTVIAQVQNWLGQNITNPTSPPLDRSLASASAAAPADMVGDLKDEVDEGFDITYPTYNEVTGKYISSSGSEASSNAFNRSPPIAVSAGEVVSLTAVGYQTQVAMIALSNQAGTSFTSVVASTDSNPHTYKYEVVRDGYIVVSYNKNYAHELKIYGLTSSGSLNKRLATLEVLNLPGLVSDSGMVVVVDDVVASVGQSGKYINSSGNVTTSSSYMVSSVISMPAKSTIVFRSHGYQNQVALLAKVVDNSYTPLVLSYDNYEHEFTYKTPEAINVVISTHTSTIPYYSIVSSRIDETEAKLNEIEVTVNALQESNEVIFPTYTVKEGYYISNGGGEYTSSAFSRSYPIAVSANQVISFTARGYSTNIAMISLTNAAGTTFTPVVVSTDSTTKEYKYFVANDSYIIISYDNRVDRQIKIYGSASNPSMSARLNKIEEIDIANLVADVDLNVIARDVTATVNESGKYITSSGNVIDAANYNIMTGISIPANASIQFNAKGYQTQVSLLSKVSGNKYVPLVISYDNDEHNFSYTASEAMTVVITTHNSVTPVYSIFTSRIDRNEARLNDVEDVVDILSAASEIRTPAYEIVEGYYIANSGVDTQYAGYNRTHKISLNTGDVIKVMAEGYQHNVAMISMTNQAETTFTPVTLSDGNTVQEYTYSAPEPCYVVASYRASSGITVTIYGKDSSVALNERLRAIESQNVEYLGMDAGMVVITPTTPMTIGQAGKFITNSGNVSEIGSYNISTVISLPANSSIQFNAGGYQTNVSLLAKVTSNNAYLPLIVSSDNDEHVFLYTATEDMDVVISSHNTVMTSYSVFSSRIDENAARISVLEQGYSPERDYVSFSCMGVIGDSLASGASNYPGGAVDRKHYSWGKYIEREHGISVSLFTAGGLTTKSWLSYSGGLAALQSADVLECYMIGLGVNDAYSLGMDYLGTTSDIHVGNEAQNADSYYGNYSRIIAAIKAKSPRAKIFCMTNPRQNDSTKEAFNEAIKDVVELYTNTYLIDLVEDEFYNSSDFNATWYGAHSTATGYKMIARNIYDHINSIIKHNLNEFTDVQFIIENHP